jgi:hypothetical protein
MVVVRELRAGRGHAPPPETSRQAAREYAVVKANGYDSPGKRSLLRMLGSNLDARLPETKTTPSPPNTAAALQQTRRKASLSAPMA